MAKLGQKFNKYSKEFIKSFLNEVKAVGVNSACKVNNVNYKTAVVWKNKYLVSGSDPLEKMEETRGRKKEKNLTIEDYKEQLQILKKFHAFQEKRITEKLNLLKEI